MLGRRGQVEEPTRPQFATNPDGSPAAGGGGAPPMQAMSESGFPYIPARPDSTVTAGSVQSPSGAPGPRVSLQGPGQPNVNYMPAPGAQNIAQRFGGQLNTQDMSGDFGPAGPISEPIRSASFPGQPNYTRGAIGPNKPYEVDMPAGQIADLLDIMPEFQVREMLGLAPQTVGLSGPNRLMSGEIDPRQYGRPLTPEQQRAEDEARRRAGL